MHGVRRFCVLLAGAGAATLLASCALLTAPVENAPLAPTTFFSFFELTGRISVRNGEHGEFGRLLWRNAREFQQIQLLSPMGQTVAEITQSGNAAAVLRTGSETRSAANFDGLTQDVLGAVVPVRDIASWIQGAIDPAAADSIVTQRDGAGRPLQLTHAGWEVAIEDYRRFGDAAVAARVTAVKGETVVKLIIDEWKALP
jgi:outer membrane lipoprotein LolB